MLLLLLILAAILIVQEISHIKTSYYQVTKTCRLVGRIVNFCADESVLGENGKVDVQKLAPITYDPMNHHYLVLGDKVGQAFHDGAALK